MGQPEAGGAKPQSVHRVEFGVDLSSMSPEQVESLRTRLREVSSGIADQLGGGVQMVEPNHSSHGDTDGWI